VVRKNKIYLGFARRSANGMITLRERGEDVYFVRSLYYECLQSKECLESTCMLSKCSPHIGLIDPDFMIMPFFFMASPCCATSSQALFACLSFLSYKRRM